MAVKTKFGDGLQRGDILHVKVGMIDGDFKWIPTADDLERYADMWQSQVPEGVKVIVTPIGVETEIIGGQLTIKPDGHDMSPFSIVDIEMAHSYDLKAGETDADASS